MKKSSERLYAVILAGGHGERFWPWSRSACPKQFLPVACDRPMLRETVDRLEGLIPPERVYVCTNEEYSGKVCEILPELPSENLIAEPSARNTAPAVGLSSYLIASRDEDAVIAVLPSDHVIPEAEKFRESLALAAEAAADGESIVVFGVKPAFPETGYGYINAPVPGSAGRPGLRMVEGFEEKPGRARAGRFFESGGYYWNSGMFVWSGAALRGRMEKHMPGLHEGLLRIVGGGMGNNPPPEMYRELPAISVDYGIMEKTRRAVMVEADFSWDDVGSWDALARVRQCRGAGNVVLGGEFIGIDTTDSVIAADGVLVAAVGVSGMVVAAGRDAVLVCTKSRAQEVKKVVELIKKSGRLKNLA